MRMTFSSDVMLSTCRNPAGFTRIRSRISREWLRVYPRSLTTASTASPSRQWTYPPTTTDITNDTVARLAKKPLYSLKLADLVR